MAELGSAERMGFESLMGGRERAPRVAAPAERTAPLRVLRGGAPPAWRLASPLGLALQLWSQRDLVRQLTAREILGRYRGSHLGVLWSFLTPLLLLAVYTTVFGAIFRRSWSGLPGTGAAATPAEGWAGHVEFALTVFCGLLVFNVFSECVSKAPNLVVHQPSYVKKVVFPLEILPVAVLGSSLAHAAVGVGLLVTGLACLDPASLSPAMLWFPLVLVPLAMLCLGLGWILSSLGVFVRDVGHAVVVVTQMLFFMTPIFYSIDMIPEPYVRLLELNPLAHSVEDARRVLIWGEIPQWEWWAGAMLVSLLTAVLGYAFFMKSKRAFADVL